MNLLTYIQYVCVGSGKRRFFPCTPENTLLATLPEDQYPFRSILIYGLVSLNLLRELLA